MSQQIKEIVCIKELLKSKGLKVTPQRLAVYESMRRLGHASADMVGIDLADTYPTLTVATIYNVLEMFVECGLLSKRFSSNNKMYFDVNTYNHIHVYCEEEHSFTDYEDTALVEMIEEYMRGKRCISGIDIDRVEIQLIGRRHTASIREN